MRVEAGLEKIPVKCNAYEVPSGTFFTLYDEGRGLEFVRYIKNESDGTCSFILYVTPTLPESYTSVEMDNYTPLIIDEAEAFLEVFFYETSATGTIVGRSRYDNSRR